MQHRTALACLVPILAFAAPGVALADVGQTDCTLNIQQLGEAHIASYNALMGGEYIEPIRLRLNNPGATDCVGTLRFRNMLGAARLKRPGGGALAYTIVDEQSRSVVLFDPATSTINAIGVSVPAHRSVEIQPRLVVGGSQPGHSGNYSASLQVDFRPAGSLLDQAGTVSLSAQVVPSAQANFVGYGKNATLDLGELSPGKTGAIDLQIRASTDVDVEISSEQHGALVHGTTHIPYLMSVGGAPVDLSAKRTMAVALPDPIKGRTTPVAVTVGDFADAPVGRYSDIITFRISAR